MLADTDSQQGIFVRSLAFTGVNFWLGGTVGTLTASDPCSVMISESENGTALIAVSDPMRMRTSLTLTRRRPVAAVTPAPGTLASAATGSTLTLTFGDLTGTSGAPQQVAVRLG
ncbi:polysaccharide lyase beta-sandwich domain-containing protein [Streptomyces sp. IMTB 2501]|uniref:polysaccharide lyase beta-sandwich domain-containing protein n=1 Tax=Streptomyces sp. IMTB 2501 TaxID=1776340 RepID=UPI0015B86171|nr:polysaccharide lyase beta-sandwich domain-containing protein [Streptomyces sp. IMTB 2501]